MIWETMKSQLEAILDAPLRLEKVPLEGEFSQLDKGSITYNHEVYFLLRKNGHHNDVLVVNEALLTPSERHLIEMMLEAYRQQDQYSIANKKTTMSKEEKLARELRDWIQVQIDRGVEDEELPAPFATHATLYTGKVPMLLCGDYFSDGKVSYKELKKLLATFFDVEMLLIPLQDKEWFILCSESIISDEEGIGENKKESLTSLCLGLYDMMVSEGFGECHLSVCKPIIPASSLLSTVRLLRETVALGQMFSVGQTIHLPWELQLERIVHFLPEAEKRRMIKHIFKKSDYFIDSETMQTLEQFFAVDGNMSETSKKLYIHRNTLAYRLDRFKQETGLDVRSFNDGILAKIGLLLYKVTKFN